MDGVQLFTKLAASLRSEFDLSRDVPHRGEAGRAGEHVVRGFLRSHLPRRFDVTDGFVFGRQGAVSGQCDLLIVDALNSSPLVWSPGIAAYPIESIVARIEVTQTLTKSKFEEDCRKLITFRRMEPVLPYARKRHAEFAPSGLLFARHAEGRLLTVVKWFAASYAATEASERPFFPNALLVLDLGLIFMLRDDGDAVLRLDWSQPDSQRIGWTENPHVVLAAWLQMLLKDMRGKLRIRAQAYADSECEAALARGEVWPQSLTPAQREAISKLVGATEYFLDPVAYFTDDQILEALLPVTSMPILSPGLLSNHFPSD